MIPMIPKINVSPLATRKSSSPYCSVFNSWIRNDVVSTRRIPSRVRDDFHSALYACGSDTKVVSDPTSVLHLAANGRIGKILERDADRLVLLAFDLAQIKILHRVVRLR